MQWSYPGCHSFTVVEGMKEFHIVHWDSCKHAKWEEACLKYHVSLAVAENSTLDTRRYIHQEKSVKTG